MEIRVEIGMFTGNESTAVSVALIPPEASELVTNEQCFTPAPAPVRTSNTNREMCESSKGPTLRVIQKIAEAVEEMNSTAVPNALDEPDVTQIEAAPDESLVSNWGNVSVSNAEELTRDVPGRGVMVPSCKDFTSSMRE